MGRRARYWGDSGKRSSNATLLGVGLPNGDAFELWAVVEEAWPPEYDAGGVLIR
jgi:hypothetical protein